jgi:isoprenylcysteine carboxyl methyltransferase (ICMT) family protein YpbQ
MSERVFTILVIACGLAFLSVPIAAIWLPKFVTAGAAITLATFIAAQVVKLTIIADLLGLIFSSLKRRR